MYFRFVPQGTRTSCLCDVHICIFIQNVWDVQNTLPNYIRTNTCSEKVNISYIWSAFVHWLKIANFIWFEGFSLRSLIN